MHAAPSGGELHTSGWSSEIPPRDDVIVVTLDGDVDMATAPVFATAVERAARAGLRVVVVVCAPSAAVHDSDPALRGAALQSRGVIGVHAYSGCFVNTSARTLEQEVARACGPGG